MSSSLRERDPEKYAAQLERNREWKRQHRNTVRGGLQSILDVSKLNARQNGNRTSRTREWDLTLDHLEQLWVNQGGRCALSGIEMTNIRGQGHHHRVGTNVSLDRIDPNEGYTVGNVQLVCAFVNRMKTDLTQSDFIETCHRIVQWTEVI